MATLREITLRWQGRPNEANFFQITSISGESWVVSFLLKKRIAFLQAKKPVEGTEKRVVL